MYNQLFDRLQNEHTEVKRILTKILQSPVSSRNNLFNELKINLIPHIEAEEKTFYPILAQKQESHQASLEALEEHRVAKILFNELQNDRSDSDNWLAKCKVFKDLLEHHIEEEESEIFKLTRKVLSEQDIAQVYKEFLSEQNYFKGRLAA